MLGVELFESGVRAGAIRVAVVQQDAPGHVPASAEIAAHGNVLLTAKGGDGEPGRQGGDGQTGMRGRRGTNATRQEAATVR